MTTVVGYLFGWTAGNKLLEQPMPVKLTIVVVMLMFLYNLGMTIWKAKRLTTTEGVLMAGLALTAILYLPSLLEFDNYTVAIFYRWWTVHLWVEGVWEMIQGALLAYLLIRLSGIDREVMEKWLYVIVGLTFISGLLGTAHHYYFVGVPSVLASDRRFLLGARAAGVRRACRRTPIRPCGDRGCRTRIRWPLHWTLGSALFSALGAGLLGLAHTWPSVNKWTHGTLITPMHGHSAFFGAYVMIVLAVITYAMPALMGHPESQRESKMGLWAFWLQVGGMFGMTMAFAAAGIGQVYLERILGLRLPRDAGEDSGPLPDAHRDGDPLHAPAWRCSSGTSFSWRRGSASRATRWCRRRPRLHDRSNRPGAVRVWRHCRMQSDTTVCAILDPKRRSISRRATKLPSSRRATHEACPSCSRDRLAAARPDSWSTWPGVWDGRS